MDTNIELIQQIRDALESDRDRLKVARTLPFRVIDDSLSDIEKSLSSKVFQLDEHLKQVLGGDEEG